MKKKPKTAFTLIEERFMCEKKSIFFFVLSYFCLILVGLQPLEAVAQGSAYQHADSLFWAAVAKKEKGKFEASLELQEKAAKEFQQIDSVGKEIECYLEMGILYAELRRFSDASAVFQRAEETIRMNLPPLSPVEAEFHSDLSMYFYATGAIDSALVHNEKALKIWQLNYGFTHLRVARAYKERGDILGRLGDYSERKKCYALTLSIREELLSEADKDWGGSLMNMALFHFQAGDYQRALAFHGAAIEIWTREFGADSYPRMGEGYLNLGSDLLRLGSPELALTHFDHASKVMERHHGADYFQLPFVDYAKGMAFLEMGNADSCRFWMEQAMESIAQQNMPVLQYLAGKCNLALGDVEFREGNLEAAFERYTAAREILVRIAGPNNSQTIRSDLKHVTWWQTKGELDSAAVYLGQLQDKLVTSSEARALSVPPPSEVINPLFYLKSMILAAELERDQAPDRLTGLRNAGQAYAKGIQFVKQLRETYTLPSRLALQEGTLPLYEGAILNQIHLFELTQNPAELEKGFEILELTKALSLWDQMQPVLSEKFVEIPDSLLERERELRGELDRLRQQVSTQSTGYQELQKLQAAYEQLHDSLVPQEEISLFNQMKNYSLAPRRFQKAIAKHAPGTGFLDFFYGEKQLILFVVTEDTLMHQVFPLSDTLHTQLQIVREGQRHLMRYESEKQAYGVAASALGQQLVTGPLSRLANVPENLVITTDGALEPLAFEALLTQQPDMAQSLNFRRLPWLMEQFPICYSHSAGLTFFNWRTGAQTKGTTQPEQVVAFAPVHFPTATPVLNQTDKEGKTLASLVYSAEELSGIHSVLEGQFLQEEAASRERFLEEAEQPYSVIHLATHANASDQCPECSWIAFSDGYLYPHDILKLDLQAELVVLSACTTEFGRVIPGEGMLSLSRYFLLAGCPATVAGKWEYNDATTASIMQAFYAEIAAGKPIDIALRNSKMTYLQNDELLKDHPDWAQPYFWATATIKGDRKAVLPAPPRYTLAMSCFLAMVLLIGAGLFPFHARLTT